MSSRPGLAAGVRRVVTGLAVVLLVFTATPASGSSAGSGHRPKPTVVLVHGAFADASSWSEVVPRLQRKGYPVLAPANPLRGVDSDSAYLASVLSTISGPIVLVGHSYGGVVITNAATGNASVKALVYVAAFAPDAGDTVGGLQVRFPGTKLGLPALDVREFPLAGGGVGHEGYVKPALFRDIFAGDLPPAKAALLAATQRPADVQTLGQVSGEPAWRTIPSWALIARDDNLIPAAAQRFTSTARTLARSR
ncbi:alpha/beta hydrolase family protein [Saccharothrix saharensis]|uniref:Alpha/beta hydrolase family protein n=1 Tax=Saccharothrix saharensis TaxID=571190 RepID=A0A543JNP7_9PSEU|nr:alpha/beta hydrolase family protein [Saccharothrix saharensis]